MGHWMRASRPPLDVGSSALTVRTTDPRDNQRSAWALGQEKGLLSTWRGTWAEVGASIWRMRTLRPEQFVTNM